MSATTMTQTTIKTQSVTSYHHHQPLLAASPCIIQSPTTEHQRRSTPLRCSARLISQSSSSSSILPTLPSPSSISTRRKRRRASTKNTTSSCSNSNTNLLRLSIGNPAPPFSPPVPSSEIPILLSPLMQSRPIVDPSHSLILRQARQPFATWSATSQPYRTKSKRRTALPPAHYVRSKKIKIHHSFFRSPQVLYPVDYSLNTHASSRNSSSSSSALSRSRTIQNPKWLHTSTAAEGQPSRMGPPEAHYTGEAALRLKKWVIWNSWVRGRAQMRFYPIAQQIPSNQRISPITPSQAINSSEGNEMFDENGDLICEEDDEEEEEEEPRKQVEDKTQSCSSPPVQQRPSTPKPNRIPVHKSHTIIKLKIPPRTSSIQQIGKDSLGGGVAYIQIKGVSRWKVFRLLIIWNSASSKVSLSSVGPK
ncbi:hypothetical protein H4Q26_007745 [Puccinia striiformis f. sp. tritici PST-130]|nr:hypothetical protein H4Q26_007745 [Puccinia striiformis f. sp. tritici PST-130]